VTFFGASALALLIVLVWIAWQFLIPRSPAPYAVAFFVGEFQRRSGTDSPDVERSRLSSPIPPIPWLDADRKALEPLQVFGRTDKPKGESWNPPREVMGTRLDPLDRRKPEETDVV
jgi:hypothetical protein